MVGRVTLADAGQASAWELAPLTATPPVRPKRWLVTAMPIDRSVRVGQCLAVTGEIIAGSVDDALVVIATGHSVTPCPR